MKRVLLLLAVFSGGWAAAQNLPERLTPDEQNLLPGYTIPYHTFNERSYNSSFSPPATAPRTMAEWEESQGYLVTYTTYNSMIRDIISNGKQECRMYVVTTNIANTITDLANNNIDTTNITFLNVPYNSVWSRDYGQWCIYANKVDTLGFIDWIYNRPRPKDDTVPSGLARLLNVPIYHTTQAPNDLVHTGGNFMCDGMGTGFSSKLILTDNQPGAGFGVTHTEAEIDTIMSRFMGINRYIKMETLPYDDIHHIDMHIKLLDEETLMVGQYPNGVADGPQIEANLQYVLANYHTAFGTDYRVVRIPMPDDNGSYPNTTGTYYTYTNASFINKTIIVPTYNLPSDTTALRIWREACPGYKVVGINSTSSITALGALHCITKEIGADNPLLITHQRLRDTYNTTTPYTVVADVEHKSGIFNATLYYTTDTTHAYQSVAMANQGNNMWQADIPAQVAGTEVFYYIHAQSNSGKKQYRPITGPKGFYNFHVLDGSTGISVVENKAEVSEPFPNPSHGLTCLPVSTTSAQKLSIVCYNALGQQVEEIFSGETKAGDNHYFINTSSFAGGVYFIKYHLAGTEITRRLVVR